MRLKKVFALSALLLGIGVMGYARRLLAQTNKIYREGDSAYADLIDTVKGRRAAGSAIRSTAGERDDNAAVRVPEIGIDFDALTAVTGDAAAWLYCPGTAIDYPVMRADDYAYYLYRLPDGTPNANGSLFIDYNCGPDFGDPLTVIYGHSMRSGSMFGSLKGYREQAYYDEHPYMYLYTERGNYRIDLLYGCVIDAGQWRERAFMYAENAGALIAYAANGTTFTSGAVYAEGDRIVAMSTCSYEFEDARYVVIGVLNEER